MRTAFVQRVSKALCIRTLRWEHAVQSLPACDVFTIRTQIVSFYFFMRELCVIYV